MKNGRCRMHGGPSTGPRTPEGKERARLANWKTGIHSQAFRRERREFREMLKDFERLAEMIDATA